MVKRTRTEENTRKTERQYYFNGIHANHTTTENCYLYRLYKEKACKSTISSKNYPIYLLVLIILNIKEITIKTDFLTLIAYIKLIILA